MQPWEEVHALRKAGKPLDALRKAKEHLANGSHFRLQGEAEWAVYYLIKEAAAPIEGRVAKNSLPKRAEVEVLEGWLREFMALKQRTQDLAFSCVVGQLVKIGRHLDCFLPFLTGAGSTWLRAEDFQPNNFQGKALPSLSVKVAREAAAWVKVRPDCDVKFVQVALSLCREAESRAQDEDKTWLDWSLAALLRRTGDRLGAAQLVVRVLKKKRTEFWTWAEVARLEREDQPELSIACFCQALSLGAEPKFVCKVHFELAEVLAAEEDFEQASVEARRSARIYEEAQFRQPARLEALLRAPWYMPEAKGIEPATFYAEHASEALQVCYDEVKQVPASYLGGTQGRDGRKPKPRFAVLWKGNVISMLGRRNAPVLKGKGPGAPVTLLIGSDGERDEVFKVLERQDGNLYDTLETCEGVVSRSRHSAEDFVQIYISRTRDTRARTTCWSDARSIEAGTGARVYGVMNPVSGRFDIEYCESIPLPQHPDVRRFAGRLSRTAKGFGFADGVFIPAALLSDLAAGVQDVSGVAVMSFDKSKQHYNWSAVSVSGSS